MSQPHNISLALVAALVSGTLASVAMPAAAQATVEELTVTGRYGRVPDSVRSLSQAVSYADLDLSTAAGKRELRQRVSLTARYLCDRLGESSTGDALVASCRDLATRDAMARVATVEASFAPRGTTWVAGPAWKPPYPAEWTKTYPYAGP